jgi:hypothetical protein
VDADAAHASRMRGHRLMADADIITRQLAKNMPVDDRW